MTTELATDRLIVRRFRGGDWKALYEMICQYEASELAAYDQPWPTAPEAIQQITEWFASGESYLAVCMKETGRLIGFVSLTPEAAEGERVLNLGYVFNFDYHGRGYATEACQAVLSHAFNDLAADSVVTGTAAANHASCRLLERLGFRKTAENPISFRNAPDGAPVEFIGVSFELTREAWNLSAARDGRLVRKKPIVSDDAGDITRHPGGDEW